jgi:hypothetical protein
MDEKTDYKTKIQNLLSNPPAIVKADEKPVDTRKTGEKIKSIFKMEESAKMPEYISEDLKEEITEKYHIVKTPSSYADVDSYWNTIKPQLRKFGYTTKYSPNREWMFECKLPFQDQIEKILEVFPVRDITKNNKPGLYFKLSDNSELHEDNVLPELSKHGFKWDESDVKKVGNGIVVHTFN